MLYPTLIPPNQGKQSDTLPRLSGRLKNGLDKSAGTPLHSGLGFALVIQINSNTEELRPKEPHRPRVPCAAWQLLTKPALALTRIIVGKQMRSTVVPAVA